MLAASDIRATSLSVDPAPDHEVALIYSRSSELDASRLAGSLRGQGHQTRLVPASPHACAEALRGGGAPLLLVATADELDTPVLRSRLARELEREHSWLDRTRPGCGQGLFRQVCARMNTLRCEETIEAPFVPRLEVVPPEVVGIPPASAAQPARPVRGFRAQLLVWPLLGAVTTALGMVAFRPAAEEPPPQAEVQEPAVTHLAVANAETPEKPADRVEIKPAPLPPPPSTTPTPTAQDPVAIAHERVTATDGLLVYAARERPRDWYAAMNLCRGRTHAGVRGWSTPSSKQLNALAKARVLPDGALWSRTRALKTDGVAFVVHGRAGTARATTKSETLDMAVCVRKQPPPQ